jgi:hypothetical protein
MHAPGGGGAYANWATLKNVTGRSNVQASSSWDGDSGRIMGRWGGGKFMDQRNRANVDDVEFSQSYQS